MTRTTPVVQNATLLIDEDGQTSAIVVGSEQWFSWLDKDTSTIFSFQSSAGSYTARKERAGNQRGSWYWKAYRTFQGRLYRAYLGKTEDLTQARLNEIALTLATRIQQQTKRGADHARTTSRGQRQEVPEDQRAPLLTSKLHPPRLGSGLVQRTRLLDKLNTCFIHKLTLLVAPTGFGKSTLINQWLNTQPAPPVTSWVSLEASDNDPLRFWRAVVTACVMRLENPERLSGEEALAMLTTSSSAPFDPPPLEKALTRLLNTLAESSASRLLVLDDYHHISDPLIHESLAFFIDHLPTNIQVVLLSRSEPALPLLRWRARGEIAELHGAELRFSLEETANYFKEALTHPLSEAALKKLDSALEGWAAGLRLLSLALSSWHPDNTIEQALLEFGERAGQKPGISSGLHSSLFAYFVTEILDTQEKETQSFLLSTSMLSRLCAPLCDMVTGTRGSADQLETVTRAGLFLEAIEGPGGWYRYHALFAEAMRHEASRRLGEEVLRSLSARACAWYEQEGLLLEAIDAAWLAQNMEGVARLIELVYLQDSTELQSMLLWLERLPEAVLRDHPLLCFLYATELRFPIKLWFAEEPELAATVTTSPPENRTRIESLLSMAEEGWQKKQDGLWLGGIQAYRTLNALLAEEPPAVVLNFAKQALAFLPAQGPLDRRLQMYRSLCLYVVGQDALERGQLAEAEALLLQASADNVPPGNKFLATDLHLLIGKMYLSQSRPGLAQQYFQLALTDASELDDEKVIAEAQFELARLQGSPQSTPIEPLTDQEERVLRLIVMGWNNQEIARDLIISVNTVKYHIKHLYQKLGVSNRIQASQAARNLQIFSPQSR